MTPHRTVALPSGRTVPALGQGTWYMGDDPGRREEELRALRTGIDLGMTLIDTAEMYGNGAAEELVGEAVRGRRDEVFLVSKVLPWNASARGTVTACHDSLRRMDTGHIDLYLLHWRGPVPLEETVEALERLEREGDIGGWGVSNLDVDDLDQLPAGARPETDQVLYNLTRRGPEYALFPRCRELAAPVMAYSPIEQGRLLGEPALAAVAEAHGVSPAQVALAWVLRHEDVIAIPKAATRQHVEDNHAALRLELTDEDLRTLDAAFPPPARKEPLEIL
ncbi:aldo/keto reductase [Streptomyces sp. HNM0574]|uniref:aldo/keto reductase n=1 Tax=Streptomyces sp. HNM0574 TaxID=2714954 RepID=UPI00146CEA3F|nr:aldo/keto reductase [Streptomyces sp. HNM0574]NLU71060.1 aldo/keto reductase [Streptomyces sp. HNM0574]